jgi:hypothetical protein
MIRNVAGPDGIESGSDIGFEKRWRRTQWIVWVVVSLFVIGGLAGVFGRGPLSKRVVDSGPVRIEYERFARFKTPATITIMVRSQPDSPQPITVTVDDELLEAVRIEQTSPRPADLQASVQGTTFTFGRRPQGITSIRFVQEPAKIGSQLGRLGIDGQAFVLHQFVYP